MNEPIKTKVTIRERIFKQEEYSYECPVCGYPDTSMDNGQFYCRVCNGCGTHLRLDVERRK